MLWCVALLGCTERHPVLLSVNRTAATDDGTPMGLPTDAAVEPDAASPRDAAPGISVFSSRHRILSAGRDHTCVLRNSKAWCWGDNRTGAFLDEPRAVIPTPRLVHGDRSWISLSAGYDFSCGLDTDSTVWCWGNNDLGQLAQGDFTPRSEPVAIPFTGRVRQLDVHGQHGCVVTFDGELWCWGNNTERQLGIGGFPPGDPEPTPVRVGDEQDWQWVGLGEGHTCGIRSPGALWCWGRNSASELGLGDAADRQYGTPQRVGNDEDWNTVSAGVLHTCGLKQDGSAWCWGNNDFKQLGVGDAEPRSTPTQVRELGDVAFLEAHHFNSCALTSDGGFWCWGWNEVGALGTGDRVDSPLPAAVTPEARFRAAAVGWQHCCGLRSDDAVLCAGQNDQGQLGDGTTMLGDTFQPVTGFP